MPSHVHTPPQCGFWTGHDPACFDQAFGVERECVLIEAGKNKGSYLCIHERAPITSESAFTRHDVQETVQVTAAGGCKINERGFTEMLSTTLAEEYGAIHAQLRPPAAVTAGTDAAPPSPEPPAAHE